MVSCNWCTHNRPASSRGRKIKPCAEVEEDVGGLRNHELARLEERRREWGVRGASAFDELHHRRDAALAGASRHVDVVGARLLQGEANEFAAALDPRPVIKLVAPDSPQHAMGV